ncbi:type III pantothenate kinase, partial [Thermoproteota archaeon]
MRYTLVLDIGNTTISLGLFKFSKLVLNSKMPTHRHGGDFYFASIDRLLKKSKIKKEDVGEIAICSVVPK